MSTVLRSTSSGASLFAESGVPHCRHVTIQLYCGVPLLYKNKEFVSGCVAVVLPTEQCKTRANRERDTTMRVWTGLISRKPDNHPSWEGRLLRAVPEDSVLAIETPNSPENLSAATVQHSVDGTSVLLDVPGTWALQIATPTFTQMMTLLGDVIDITLLDAGWVHMGLESKVLQRRCFPVGGSSANAVPVISLVGAAWCFARDISVPICSSSSVFCLE